MAISGSQRLRNIRTKARLEADRNLKEFLAGNLSFLPSSDDRLNDLIAQEFDRLATPPQEQR